MWLVRYGQQGLNGSGARCERGATRGRDGTDQPSRMGENVTRAGDMDSRAAESAVSNDFMACPGW